MTEIYGVLALAALFGLFGLLWRGRTCGGDCGRCGEGTCRKAPEGRPEGGER